tara:strand:- start:481 stop:660 length:180 start_codon:yes stop_codon:yes gene_type:complete
MDKKIDVKIGTKEEALWTRIKKEALVLIEQSNENLIVQKAMLKLATDNIKKEEAKGVNR